MSINPEEVGELVDKVVFINRVAKVVKGGKNFAFAALVVVGDQKGRIGYGHGKAREVPEAIRKATEEAKKSMVRVPLREGRTLHHDVKGVSGAGRVLLRSAPAGTGVIAAGVTDILTKSFGTSNPHNVIHAVVMALKALRSAEHVARVRGRTLAEMRGTPAVPPAAR